MASRDPITGRLSRRRWLRLSTVGAVSLAGSSWLAQLAAQAADQRKPRKRSCILLWMAGGPSQIDTFDPKPDHENGGSFKSIATATPGIRICEHLPELASQSDSLALIRSMTTKEGDHARATYLLRTGRLPQGTIRYPALGSALSKELGLAESEIPNFVSIAPETAFSPAAYGPGFLGPACAPLVVADRGSRSVRYDASQIPNLSRSPGVLRDRFNSRLELLSQVDQDFSRSRPDITVQSHRTAYEGALRMMRGSARQVFDLSTEPSPVRDAYGRNQFGQGCLLARRLVEHGVPFVEVTLSEIPDAPGIAWDTHRDNFATTSKLCGVLDRGWSQLMSDLRQRGLLESTLIVWMGEFGRTPKINTTAGRDHFPVAWSTVLAGGPVRGGQVYGRTATDGMTVEEQGVTVSDLLATICRALEIDPSIQNISNIGRPISIVEPEGQPIRELLA